MISDCGFRNAEWQICPHFCSELRTKLLRTFLSARRTPPYSLFFLFMHIMKYGEMPLLWKTTTSYTLRRTEDRLVFEIGAREGAYVPPMRRILIKVHAVDTQVAEGHPSASYDPDRRLLTLQVDDDGSARTWSFKLGI